MPIKIPDGLPGTKILEAEGVPLITEGRALRQDIRPLQILLLNLMPDKIRTETQLLRAIGATPLQVEVTLLHMASHISKNTAAEHLTAFYQQHDAVKHRNFDGLVVTGAPVEQMEYAAVGYWPEMTAILDWAATHVYSSFFICWAAQAALKHYHGIEKHALPQKKSGIYPHRLLKPFAPITAGFDDIFAVPVSRHSEIRAADIAAVKDLEVLAASDEAGPYLVQDAGQRRTYIFNHPEYDAETLRGEYIRDSAVNPKADQPFGYFPEGDARRLPALNWRAHRNLLFGNWVNLVYQGTPYNLEDLGVGA